MDRTDTASIAISVNGERREVAAGSTVLDVARACGLRDDERGVAIARRGAVVRRADWATTAVAPDDALEVVRATAGG